LAFNTGIFRDFPVRLRCGVRVLHPGAYWKDKVRLGIADDFLDLREESSGVCGLVLPSASHRVEDAWVIHTWDTFSDREVPRFRFGATDRSGGSYALTVEKFAPFLQLIRENRWAV
jgi:hypothetical protein